MEEQPKARDAIRQIVTNEIQEYKDGSKKPLSTTPQIARKLNIHPKYAAMIIRTEGLTQERKAIAREIRRLESIELTHSTELAWLLGVIASGGSTCQDRRINFVTQDIALLDKFQGWGEMVFETSSTRLYRDKSKDIQGVYFHNNSLYNWLGDLRRTAWPTTLYEKHDWILGQTDYLWQFIEGFFETRGYVEYGSKKRAGLRTNYVVAANTLTDLLTSLGTQRPNFRKESRVREGIRGVEFNTIYDLQLIASNIHFVKKDKEEILEKIRNSTPSELKHIPTNEEVIEEARRLYQIYGVFPSSNKIQEMRIKGETCYSTRVYINRFGG
jgi:hypothetical protein